MTLIYRIILSIISILAHTFILSVILKFILVIFHFGFHLGWIFLISEELRISLVQVCWWGILSFFPFLMLFLFCFVLFSPWRIFSWSADFSFGSPSLSVLWRWHSIDFCFSLLLLRSQFIVLFVFLENNVSFSL